MRAEERRRMVVLGAVIALDAGSGRGVGLLALVPGGPASEIEQLENDVHELIERRLLTPTSPSERSLRLSATVKGHELWRRHTLIGGQD